MIRIDKTFTAYPDGRKRVFGAGEEVSDLPAEVEVLYEKKGFGTRKKADTTAGKKKKDSAK